MNYVHPAHGPTGIVEYPFLVQVDVVGVHLRELVGDVAHDRPRVIAMCLDSPLRQVVQLIRLQDVEGVEVLLQQVDDRREDADQYGDESQYSRRHRDWYA
jgi:hypothetical protein